MSVSPESDLKALITNGHHMEKLLRGILPVLYQVETPLRMYDGDEPLDEDDMSDLCASIRKAVYEWDKRASRTGVDWWNESKHPSPTTPRCVEGSDEP